MRWFMCFVVVAWGCDDGGAGDPSDGGGAVPDGGPADARAGALDGGAADGAVGDGAVSDADGGVTPDAAPPGAPPNLLLVIADDLGVDNAPCYADGAARAPTIQGLCGRGVVFDNAWVNPMCSPTRATLLTGLYGLRTGVGTISGGQDPGIPADARTLPQMLDGYATACLGKWHLGDRQNGAMDSPNLMGFDHFAGLYRGALDDYYDWPKLTNGEASQSTTYATTDHVDDAIAWVDQQDRPWLLWLAFVAPHTPFHLPPDHLQTTGLTGDDIRQNQRAYYDAAIEAMDTELGRLLDHLGPETLANTHIIFVGDNGSPGQVARDPDRAKTTLYQGGIHVPLVYAGPASAGGRREPALVNGVDLPATLLDLAGRWSALDPSEFDGRSLVPLLGASGAAPVRAWAYSEFFGANVEPAQTGTAARDARYKYLSWADGREAFYDLERDPFEAVDLLDGALTPETRAALEALQALP